MRRVAWRNLLAHKFRSIALVLTVVLGVSFVTGTYVLTDTITVVFEDIFDEAYSAVDVSVRTESELGTDAVRAPVPESLLATVQGVDGVAAAEGGIFAVGVEILDAAGDRVGNPMAPAFGLNWAVDDTLSPLTLRDGRKPTGPDEVAIDATSFDDGGFALGDAVRFVTPGGPRTFTLVGVAGFGRADNIAGATLSVFELSVAQEVTGRLGELDSIDVRVADGIDEAEVQHRIDDVLPDGYEAVTSDQLSQESDEALEENLAFFSTFLLVFAYIALFVGAFIIYNTFGIVVAQRTRELALLRALGATARQVLASVVFESLVLGLVASVLGLGAGLLLATALKAVLAAFGFDVPGGSLVLEPRTIVVGLLGGTLITAVSAVAPAVRASRVPPMAALQAGLSTPTTQATVRNVVGAGLAVLGVVAMVWGLSGGGLAPVGAGALAVFLGTSMLAPMLARPVVRALGAPVARLRGEAGLLARENALRSARRTAATASALMIGTALMAGALILSSSTTQSVERAVSRGALSDLVVTTQSPTGFSAAVAGTVADVDGVSGVYPYRFGEVKVDGSTTQVVGVPAAALVVDGPDAALDVDVRSGDIADLTGDTVAVQRDVADDRGWSVGDPVDVTFASGTRTLEVVALYDDDTLVGDYLVDYDTFLANLDEPNDWLVLVNLASGADLASSEDAIQAAVDADYPNVEVQDRDEYIGAVKDQVNQFLGLITALLGLAVIIALIGVLIAMLLAVYERTQEIGLLRAVGMSRRQVRSMVRWEAAIVAAFGAALGLVLGVVFGVVLVDALEEEGITDRVVPYGSLIGLAVVIAVLGVLAAAFPARRAARLNVLDAISRH